MPRLSFYRDLPYLPYLPYLHYLPNMLSHSPVLVDECLRLLKPDKADLILDATLGLGGHSISFLRSGNAKLIGLDADIENLNIAGKNLESFSARTVFINANFRGIPEILPEKNERFDIIFADLGLSSPHLDDPARGFSFRTDSTLDMRYDRTGGMNAAMLIASLDREKLKKIFEEYGELPRAGKLVSEIITRRAENPVRRTTDLNDLAHRVFGRDAEKYLPQIFQALRIAVNDELDSLKRFLEYAPGLLKPGGRLGIISYHSLEDRLVKQAFKKLSSDLPDPVTGKTLKEAEFELLTKKAVVPEKKEVLLNPRSRSARLRAIRRKNMYTGVRSPIC